MSKAPDKITLNECTFSDIGIFDVEGEVVYVRLDKVVDIINRSGGTSPVVKKSELIIEIKAI